MVGLLGQRKDKRDTPDGRWISICPMIIGDSDLGFIAFGVWGK